MAAVITIPLSNNLNSIAIILFVASCILQQPWHEAKSRLLHSKFWIIPVVLFLWYCCTYFWDVSGGFTNKELERYTILLFLPPALAMIPKISPALIKKACLAFVAITVFVCVLCLFKAYIEYGETGDYRVFFYQYLGEQMHLNAIFLSNYCLAGITWLLYFRYVDQVHSRTRDHVVTLVTAAFLLLMIFLLSSKLIILLTLLLIVVFILALGYIRGFFLRALLGMVLIVCVGVFAVANLHYLRWRFNTTEFKTYQGPEDDHNGIAIRLFMWETTLDLVRERPMTGYGLRGARTTLLDEYRRRNFDLGVRNFYHSHNQYLESSLMAGIPATFLLIMLIAAAFRKAISTRNLLSILFISHFAVQSIFEATFEVQHELVFYMLFIFLFYYHAPQGKQYTHQLQ